jgi:hypothetical protein
VLLYDMSAAICERGGLNAMARYSNLVGGVGGVIMLSLGPRRHHLNTVFYLRCACVWARSAQGRGGKTPRVRGCDIEQTIAPSARTALDLDDVSRTDLFMIGNAIRQMRALRRLGMAIGVAIVCARATRGDCLRHRAGRWGRLRATPQTASSRICGRCRTRLASVGITRWRSVAVCRGFFELSFNMAQTWCS